MKAVDVNIVIYLFIQGRHSDSAGHLFDRDANWILPDLWIHEMTNVISTYIKQDGMNINNGEKILKAAYQYFGKTTYSLPMADVLHNSVKYNISCYDSAYITLAIAHDLPLITMDKKLAKKVPEFTELFAVS